MNTAAELKKHEKSKTEHLETNPEKGLSDSEALRRSKEMGENIIVKEKDKGPLMILFEQFKDFMVMLLALATAASAFMGEYTEAIAITAIILLNAVLGFVQEYRTEKTLEALKKMAAPDCVVIRGGVWKTIPASKLVVGDVVLMEAGAKVPADAALIEAIGMQTDESLLTGESLPVTKHVKEKIHMGTTVTSGRGVAIVHAIGMNTQMGNIAGMLNDTSDTSTPLQKNLASLGKVIGLGCVAICAVVALLGILRGEPVFDMILSGISLAVAAVPEGMPAIVAVALAIGVRKMLVRNALIRRLPAVETLGCATVICSDKTGTITQNKMVIRKMFSSEGMECIDKKIKPLTPKGENLMKRAVLCCNMHIQKQAKKTSSLSRSKYASPDPTEGAIINLAGAEKISIDSLLNNHKRIHEIPFDSDKKRMTVVVKDQTGRMYSIMKGAPDVVIDCCKWMDGKNQPVKLDSTLKRSMAAVNEEMANDALRVIAVACKEITVWPGNFDELERNDAKLKEFNLNLEKEMCFVGLIGMMDPPRKEAIKAVEKCKTAGIRTIMITGDHSTTAMAVAKEVGIIDKKGYKDNVIVTGNQIDRMNEAQLDEAVGQVNVFARVSPRHKLDIVKSLKRQDHVVAMTGDGVNDAPAVREADIGVAMGKGGTDVTREAASMVLLDDNFATITAAVEQGRVIFGNIKKFIRYLLACNIGEVFVMFVTMLLGFPIPLLPIQILWVNFVTDGLPALALGFDPAESDVMMHRPRSKKEGIFSGGMGFLIISRGLLIGLCTMGVYLYVGFSSNSLEIARTAAFMMLVFAQLIHVFECRSERKTLIEFNPFSNIWLILAVMVSFILTLGVVYLPAAREIFGTVLLPGEYWSVIGLLTLAIPIIGGTMTKLYQTFRPEK